MSSLGHFLTTDFIGFVINEEFSVEDLGKPEKAICKLPDPFVISGLSISLASVPLGKTEHPPNHETNHLEGIQNEAQEACHTQRW